MKGLVQLVAMVFIMGLMFKVALPFLEQDKVKKNDTLMKIDKGISQGWEMTKKGVSNTIEVTKRESKIVVNMIDKELSKTNTQTSEPKGDEEK